ncbi:MAG: hypothetical protein QXQ87_08675, partial [Halobacteria archaeon]
MAFTAWSAVTPKFVATGEVEKEKLKGHGEPPGVHWVMLGAKKTVQFHWRRSVPLMLLTKAVMFQVPGEADVFDQLEEVQPEVQLGAGLTGVPLMVQLTLTVWSMETEKVRPWPGELVGGGSVAGEEAMMLGEAFTTQVQVTASVPLEFETKAVMFHVPLEADVLVQEEEV